MGSWNNRVTSRPSRSVANAFLPIMTPQEAIRKYGSFLSDNDKTEILDYPQIYYMGSQAQDSPRSDMISRRSQFSPVGCDHLAYKYQITKCLGKGTFGSVFEAFDHKSKTWVAVKIIKNDHDMIPHINTESRMLTYIKRGDPLDVSNCIKINSYFTFRDHFCLSFPMIGKNLFEVFADTNFEGFPSARVRIYAYQILKALCFLRSHNIIHCDLKPENILVQIDNPHKIKVIDFGSSCFKGRSHCATYLQSRFYRSPEVIMRLPFDMTIDMWSFGCILYEMAAGKPLFHGDDEFDQFSSIMEVKGTPPAPMIVASPVSSLYFNEELIPRYCVVSTGAGSQYVCMATYTETGILRQLPGTKIVEHLVTNRGFDNKFVDFYSKCTEYIASSRLTPIQATTHSWMSTFVI